MNVFIVVVAVLVCVVNGQYHGLFINGQAGTQVYNPFGSPVTHGDFEVGLQAGSGAQNSSAVLNGDMGFFAGGNGDYAFLVYNVGKNKTHSYAPLKPWRMSYGMVVLNCGDILVCGGTTGSSQVSSCELYVAGVNVWTTFRPLPQAIEGFTMLSLYGRPYVFGGNVNGIMVDTVYAFLSGAWLPRTAMPKSLWLFGAVAIDHETVIACGGLRTKDPKGPFISALATCHIFEPTPDRWTNAPSLIVPRYGHGMAIVKDRVLAFGGYDKNSNLLDSVESLVIVGGNVWETIPTPLHKADAFFAYVSLP